MPNFNIFFFFFFFFGGEGGGVFNIQARGFKHFTFHLLFLTKNTNVLTF